MATTPARTCHIPPLIANRHHPEFAITLELDAKLPVREVITAHRQANRVINPGSRVRITYRGENCNCRVIVFHGSTDKPIDRHFYTSPAEVLSATGVDVNAELTAQIAPLVEALRAERPRML